MATSVLLRSLRRRDIASHTNAKTTFLVFGQKSANLARPFRSMQMHSGVTPKETQVQNEVGGLKGMLSKLREKVFGSPWSEKTRTNQLHDSSEDRTSLMPAEVIRTEESLDAVDLNERKCENQHLESPTVDADNGKEFIAACPRSGEVSNQSAGVFGRPNKSSECAEMVELEDRCPRSGADPKVIVASGKDQEAAPTVEYRVVDRSVGEERVDVTEQNELDTRFESSIDAQLDNHRNEYQSWERDQGTARCPHSDQEEAAKVQLHLLEESNFNGKDTNTSVKAVPAEEATVVHEQFPPEKKFFTHLASAQNCETRVSSFSVSPEMALGLGDLLDDDNSVELSKDGTIQIKGLINQVKKFPKDATESRYGGLITNNYASDGFPKDAAQRYDVHNISTKNRFVVNGPDSKKKVSLTALFMHGNLTKLVQNTRQKEGQNERNLSELLLQEKYKGRLPNLTYSAGSDDDTRNKVPHDIVDSRVLEEIASHSDDIALEKNRSKPSQIPPPFKKKEVKINYSAGSDDDTRNKVPDDIVDSRVLEEIASHSDDIALEKNRSKPSQIPPPFKKKEVKINPNPLLFTEKGRDETDVLVRFVPKSRTVAEIKNAFGDCGPIGEIHFITSSDETKYKDACVRFKTKEGMRKALAKTDAVVTNSDVVVEAISLSAYTSPRVHAPSQIGISDIPPSLLRNPTRTVMVKGLNSSVSSHNLEDTLSFCGGCITGFFMGSSNSVAYIEFETEDAKEKAIAAYSMSVSGSKLTFLRIDSPNTTIVRISNSQQEQSKLAKICKSYGKVKRVTERCPDVFDVHYKLNEWPFMVNILNGLNGKVEDGHQWIAQPATEIPVEILKYLWSQPNGRGHVHSVIQNLCQKINENSKAEENSMIRLKGLATKYYEERIDLPGR